MKRPFLRPALVWLLAAVLMALGIVMGFLLSLAGGRRTFWWIAPIYIRFIGWAFGIERQLEGWEGLPEAIRKGEQPVIFIGNHTSLFDPPLVISTLPTRPVFIAKRELAYVPFLGWMIWMAGFIFIDRHRSKRAVQSLAKAAQRIRQGRSIIAFPEGTRSCTGELLPFKKGLFNVAIEAGVPIVPLVIHGGLKILPKDAWRVAPGSYRIQVGKPLDTTVFKNAEALRLASEQALRAILKA